MLVFVSDLHLTDHAAGQPELENHLITLLESIRRRACELPECKELELVLLGDTLDLLKTRRWFNNPGLRPWRTETAELGDLVLEIAREVLVQFQNFSSRLHQLKAELKGERGIECKVTYFVGNHDYLLNSTVARLAREFVRDKLGLDGKRGEDFPEFKIWPEYRVFAAHGHQFDPLNYVYGDLKPFGDAIVIELIQGFLNRVGGTLGLPEDNAIMRLLNQCYYVAPHLLAPLWTISVLARTGWQEDVAECVTEAWSASFAALADESHFRENLRRYLNIPELNVIERTLLQSFRVPGPFRKRIGILKIADKLRKQIATEESHKRYLEGVRSALRNYRHCRYGVIGHTHCPGLWPLELTGLEKEPRLYFNTGTLRQVHQPVIYANKDLRHFFSGFVSTYVLFYHPRERPDGVMNQESFEFCHTKSSWRFA